MRKVISLFLAIVMTAAVFAVAAFAIMGDVNGDGSINNKDVVALFRYASGNEDAVKDKTACDYNGDGTVNNKDVIAVFKAVSTGSQQQTALAYPFIYPDSETEHTYDADTLERFYRLGVGTGRNVRHISPGERFQLRIIAREPDIKVSLKDVEIEIISGADIGNLNENGVFEALKPGEFKARIKLKAKPSLTANFTITVNEPDKTGMTYWQGSGTYLDPFLINNKTDFLNIAKVCEFENYNNDYSKGGHWFRQTADIDLSGVDFEPLRFFIYNYNGDGHKLKNITMSETEDRSGVFGYFECGVVENLTIENYTYKRNGYGSVKNTGVFASDVYGGTFYNCHAVNIDIDVTDNGSTWSTGGFVGHIVEPAYFIGCSVSGKINGDDMAGGFYGDSECYHSFFTDCSADVAVTVTGDVFGGFAARDYNALTVGYYNCTSTQKDEILEEYNNKY